MAAPRCGTVFRADPSTTSVQVRIDELAQLYTEIVLMPDPKQKSMMVNEFKVKIAQVESFAGHDVKETIFRRTAELIGEARASLEKEQHKRAARKETDLRAAMAAAEMQRWDKGQYRGSGGPTQHVAFLSENKLAMADEKRLKIFDFEKGYTDVTTPRKSSALPGLALSVDGQSLYVGGDSTSIHESKAGGMLKSAPNELPRAGGAPVKFLVNRLFPSPNGHWLAQSHDARPTS